MITVCEERRVQRKTFFELSLFGPNDRDSNGLLPKPYTYLVNFKRSRSVAMLLLLFLMFLMK